MKDYKQDLIEELYSHVNTLIQNALVKDFKDIDFLISDLNKARQTYCDIVNSNTKAFAAKSLGDWTSAADES